MLSKFRNVQKQSEKSRGPLNEFDEIEYLIHLVPDSPNFWGNSIIYPTEKKKIWKGMRSEKEPNISKIRDDVHSFSRGERLSRSRSIISRYLKKYPGNPDIHALRAIMMYNDLSQSAWKGDKLEIMRDALREMGGALHNGGVSIFNATWFMTIYLKYLELLGKRLSRRYHRFHSSKDRQVQLASQKLYHKLIKVPRLLQARNSFRILTKLNIKLKNSSFITSPVTPGELLEACQAIAGRKEKKVGKTGKPANSIIYVTMLTYSVLSRIPSLRDMVRTFLQYIPEVNRDLILQKQLVINTGKTNDFHLSLAAGNPDLARELAIDIFDNSLDLISRFLKDSILFKQYEVDPYLKTAWIAIESRHLFPSKERRERLKEALKLLVHLLENRCQHGNSIKVAHFYQHEIESVLDIL